MHQHEKKRERGQSLVEIALSFPLLLLILSGLLDIGRVYYTYIAIEDAAAEGALYLALNPRCPYQIVAIPDCTDPNNAIFRTQNANLQQLDLQPEHIDTFVPAGNYGIGDIVRVRIRYPFRFVTPGITAITRQITLSVTATNLIICEDSDC